MTLYRETLRIDQRTSLVYAPAVEAGLAAHADLLTIPMDFVRLVVDAMFYDERTGVSRSSRGGPWSDAMTVFPRKSQRTNGALNRSPTLGMA